MKLALLSGLVMPLILLLGTSGGAVAQSSPSPSDKLTQAQVDNQQAQAAYYRRQIQDSPFWRRIGDSPAALGALIAAVVALVSFVFNYRATLKNQVDTQFYEAMKRFGDKDSPTLRSSAAGILAQMGKKRVLSLRLRRPFLFQSPYFATAFAQLLVGNQLENDSVVLSAIRSGLFELISANRRLARLGLLATHNQLQTDLIRSLAAFFISKSAGGIRVKAERWQIHDISDELWKEAQFVTIYSKDDLKWLAKDNEEEFSNDINAAVLSKELQNESERRNCAIVAQESLEKTATRLRANSDMCAKSFGTRSLLLSLLLLVPGLTLLNLRRRQWLFRPFFARGSLANIDLRKVTMWEGHFTDSYWGSSRFFDVDLQSAQMEGSVFLDTRMVNVDLRDANLKGANFSSARLSKVQFGAANLENANFAMTSLFDIDFSKVSTLRGASFVNATLKKLNFSGVDLEGSDLRFATLDHVNLERTNLKGALVYGIKLGGVDFGNLEWWKADFSFANNITDYQLERLYTRFGKSIPEDLDLDAEAHPSIRDFLKKKRLT